MAATAMVLLHLIAYGIPTGVLLTPEPAHTAVPSNTRFYHTDHLGSTVVTTYWDGATPQRSYYRPFGQAATGGGATLPEDFGFTGQRFEDEVGLYDYGARWYDPALGRFLQPDSIVPDPGDPMSWNPYSYVRNNPVNRVDPSGNEDKGSFISAGQPSLFGSLIGGFREAGHRGDSRVSLISCPHPTSTHPRISGGISTREAIRARAISSRRSGARASGRVVFASDRRLHPSGQASPSPRIWETQRSLLPPEEPGP